MSKDSSIVQLASSEDLKQLESWNDTYFDYPLGTASIPSLVHEACQKFGSRIAIEYQGKSIRYDELGPAIEHVATQLSELGINKEERVAMMMQRSENMPIVMIAIMQAGGAFVTLDVDTPDARVEFILEESGVTKVFADKAYADRFPDSVTVIDPDACLEQPYKARPELSFPEPRDLAYVLYTSGSTGRPKGVMNEQIGIVNRILWGVDYLDMVPEDRFLQKTPYTFDVSLAEFFMPLIGGACLVMAKPEGHRDNSYLVDVICAEKITYAHFVPSMLDLFLRNPRAGECSGLKWIVCTGEAVTTVLRDKFFECIQDVKLLNFYGPTEAAVEVSYFECRASDTDTTVPIGWPVHNTKLYVVDDQLRPVAHGEKGELLIGGVQVARGYIERPDITSEVFIPDHIDTEGGELLYRTGDLASYREDGALEYHGRIDNQIKVRGVRVESGEIEAALEAVAEVKKAVVKIEQHPIRGAELCAYVEAERQLKPAEFRERLKDLLAETFFPQQYYFVDSFELTSSGKVDRKQLKPPEEGALVNAEQAAQASDTQAQDPAAEWVAQLQAAWRSVLGHAQINPDDQFFDLGGSSLLAQHLVEQVFAQTNVRMSVLDIFEKPVLKDLAEKLAKSSAPQVKTAKSEQGEQSERHEIAIVGMAGRFPGAKNLAEIWYNLANEVESTTQFSLDQLDPSIDDALKNDPSYVKAAGLMPEVKCFDAEFFKTSAREAAIIDPQQRIFLEVCWHALEDAGIKVSENQEPIGVYAGSGVNTYYVSNVQPAKGNDGGIGDMPRQTATEKDYLATRVAYKLGLKGPAITVQTACSTSLVSIATACQSIRSGQIDVALAGGISVHTPQASGRIYQKGGMFSPDGITRTFDEKSEGTAFNSGAGAIVLKTKAQALRDGDRIYAVIKGLGLNNDGSDKASFTAPSIEGQKGAVTMAMRDAKVDARDISYIEAHGTGTPLGDPIEIEALRRAFAENSSSDDKQFCAIGSVKTNVGHMVAAAGVGGVIKTALAMYLEEIPASLHYKAPNPQIDFDNSPFYVAKTKQAWPQQEGKARIAGVTSLGVGGTNAHVIMEGAHTFAPVDAQAQQAQVLLLSAKKATGPSEQAHAFKHCLALSPSLSLSELARQQNTQRDVYDYRAAAVVRPAAEASQAPQLLKLGRVVSAEQRLTRNVWLFPGQGNQYPGMAADFYQRFEVYRDSVDACLAALAPSLAEADIAQLSELLLCNEAAQAERLAEVFKATQFTQLGLFICEYASAQLMLAWGLKPSAMIGHSIGEFAAATLAGIFSLADALAIVSERGRLMQAQPEGSMLSVRAASERFEHLLPAGCEIAAYNAPELCVVAGPDDAIEKCEQVLTDAGVVAKLLPTSHAFHSEMMAGAVEPFKDFVASKALHAPSLEIISSATGQVLSAAQAQDPAYWASHLRNSVQFATAISTAMAEQPALFIELGPRNSATTFAMKQLGKDSASAAIATMARAPEPGEQGVNNEALLQALGDIWARGLDLDAKALAQHMGWAQVQANSVLALPGYPFERKEHWVEPEVPSTAANQTQFKTTEQNPVITAGMESNSSLVPAQLMSVAPAPLNDITETVTMKDQLISDLKELFSEASGSDFADADNASSFFDLGFDSLLLTQVSLDLKRQYKLDIPFRRLMEDLENFELLAEHVSAEADGSVLPQAQAPAAAPVQAAAAVAAPLAQAVAAAPQAMMAAPALSGSGDLQQLINAQLSVMQMQLQALSGAAPQAPAVAQEQVFAQAPAQPAAAAPSAPAAAPQADKGDAPVAKPQARGTKIVKKSEGIELSSAQQNWVKSVMQGYQDQYPQSKTLAQEHRKYFADPRTVSGFNPEWKEMVFPIATERSKGSKLYSIEGHELIDLSNGFGPILFGHSPDFVNEAIIEQLQKGVETGPQSPMAGEVVKLFCEMTGNERAGYASTGSEAVAGAVRLARTVTGRKKVIMFEGGYHGIFDEVITRPGRDYQALPSAPGIMREAVSNMLVVPWADHEVFDVIRSLGDDLAAILVEPVQSRMPGFHDKEYIQTLRRIADETGAALIIDEVVTGFRMAAGGIQERFDVRADLATYGKILGGGHPIGMIGGKAKFLDALDGGYWQYGDDSVPEAGVTYFAGTFVRHPLALAAAKAILTEIKKRGPELYRSLEDKTSKFASDIKGFVKELGAEINIEEFGSLFYISVPHHAHWGHLLYTMMQTDGIHIQQYRACFFNTEHSQADIEKVTKSFKTALAKLVEHGLLEGDAVAAKRFLKATPSIPEGARLGKNEHGEPAYFIEDPDNKGQYIEVGKP